MLLLLLRLFSKKEIMNARKKILTWNFFRFQLIFVISEQRKCSKFSCVFVFFIFLFSEFNCNNFLFITTDFRGDLYIYNMNMWSVARKLKWREFLFHILLCVSFFFLLFFSFLYMYNIFSSLLSFLAVLFCFNLFISLHIRFMCESNTILTYTCTETMYLSSSHTRTSIVNVYGMVLLW